MTVCGIVTYNPERARLGQNLAAIASCKGIACVLVVDNGSRNVAEIAECLGEKATLIRNTRNEGIARALNQLCQAAAAMGADWILTLDQDSLISPNAIEVYERHKGLGKPVGILCCRVFNENFGNMYTQAETGTDEIRSCITSGSLVRLDAWRAVGGFLEPLFIDGVDFDFCIRVRKAGFRILRCNDVVLQQRIGQSREVYVLGRRAMILNHAPSRYYYIARNYLYIGIRHGQLPHWVAEILKRMMLVACYEQGRRRKFAFMLRGISHALRGKFYEISNPHKMP